MSFEVDRIGQLSGEWFERYVETIFKSAGFQTQRRRRFHGSVTHEIDIWAESEFAAIAVECKDWALPHPDPIKQAFDAFITKIAVIKANVGVFAINLPTRDVQRYKRYLAEHHLTLWDSADVEQWHAAIGRYDKMQFQKRLCDSLGIAIHEPTKQEKTLKIIKKIGDVAYKTAKVSAKVAENLAAEDPPRRRRRKRNRPRY